MVSKATMGSTPQPMPEAEPVIEEVTEDAPDQVEDDEEEDEGRDGFQIEDLDPKTALWEGGPTAAEAVAWKVQHGDIYITNITFDKHVIWRTLKRSEYRFLVKQMENLIQSGQMTQSEAGMRQEEMTVEICALCPRYTTKDFDSELAGLPAIISQQILESSGFNTIEVRQL